VQLVPEGSRFYSDVFRKSVNGRNIVQQSRKVKALSFSVKRNFVSIFGERPLSFSVKRIFVLIVFFGQALLLERQVFGTTWVFFVCTVSTMFQISHEIRINTYKASLE
jgi:hypothetical protein